MYEVRQWIEYRNRRGSLSIGRRVEQSLASMTSFMINTKIQDEENRIHPLTLMPHEDDLVVTFEDSIK